MIGASVRKAVFWGRDYLTGSPVRRHLSNIERISRNADQLSGHQKSQLQRLLDHAVKTTDFYGACKGFTSLNDFPVIDKNIIRESNGRILSKAFKGKKLITAQTNGSTGTPFRVVQNFDKRYRVLAEVIHSNALIGYQIGTRYAWTIASGSLDREKKIGLFMKNKVELTQNTLGPESAERHLQTLKKDRGIKIIMGYSSVLYDLARHIIARDMSPDSFGIEGILCLSEPLYPNMRDSIQRAFDCPVLSRYSNEECGVLAYECPACGRFHLNSASYLFETLALERDEPTLPGTIGRIVVTDLFNFALPMIRYDTGDLGSIVPNSCPHFATPMLQSLEGRRTDVLWDTAGRRVMMFSFDFILIN